MAESGRSRDWPGGLVRRLVSSGRWMLFDKPPNLAPLQDGLFCRDLSEMVYRQLYTSQPHANSETAVV